MKNVLFVAPTTYAPMVLLLTSKRETLADQTQVNLEDADKPAEEKGLAETKEE